ncbi:ParA family protein [Pontibacter sp. G13]|uniref:ParA family protein n=1 Tax=Pontibacter sp. G13 TaxID=3074898 RepID=UPI00288AB31E|nr:ParA family protein [Pontibacter sp. G13]WNJ21337.1 ParA family protein [Pontibacter sp. G13]
MSVISIANHKGGVGKTTTTVNLAAGMARAGHKVLVIDMDPQANASFAMGLKKQDQTIFHVLAYQDDVRKMVKRVGDIDIVPSSVHLAGFEKNNEVGKEFILHESLDSIRPEYDFILIDCPPSLGALTVSALTASDLVLIALQPESLALQGMADFIRILRTVKTRMNRELELLGIVITQFDNRKVLHRDVMELAVERYEDAVFNTKIRGNIALAESQSLGKNIFQYDANCNGATDYMELTHEVVERLKAEVPA